MLIFPIRSPRSSLHSVLWLSVPLLIFCIIPLALRPLSRLFASISPHIFPSSTSYSFSVSVSFGGSRFSFPGMSSQIPNERDRTSDIGQQKEKDETYVSQGFVIGAFLAIFFAQVGVNFLHAVRAGRRRRRFMEMQFPQPLPQRDQEPDRGFNRDPGIDTNAREESARDDAEGRPVIGNAPSVG